MENKEIKIAVPENYDGKPITLIVREGSAEAVNDPQGFTKQVSVKSIVEFIEKHEAVKANPKENPGVVIYCLHPDRPSLAFDLNPHDALAPSLSAKMIVNPELTAFGINRDVFFSNKDLEKLVLKYAHCFADVKDAVALRTHLRNFIVKYEQTVENSNDARGNTKDLVETSIKVNKGMIPLQWKLKLPLFLSASPVEIELELEIQKGANNMPAFGFYSMDLEPKIRETIFNTIGGEVEKLLPKFACLQID